MCKIIHKGQGGKFPLEITLTPLASAKKISIDLRSQWEGQIDTWPRLDNTTQLLIRDTGNPKDKKRLSL